MNDGIVSFKPALPAKRLGEIKDMAQEVIVASATLEGRIANETAQGLGDRLRFLNSYHSNLIEGHKTTIVDIEAALDKDYSLDEVRRYAQELCAAHVSTERVLMQKLSTDPAENVCNNPPTLPTNPERVSIRRFLPIIACIFLNYALIKSASWIKSWRLIASMPELTDIYAIATNPVGLVLHWIRVRAGS